MNRMFKFFMVVLMICIITTVAFAGGDTDKAASGSGQGVELTFWIFLNPTATDDPRNMVLKEIIDEYNRTNKYGNKITVESIHWSRFESQAIQAAAANTGPDIINIYSDMLRQHIAGGTVQPMTKYAGPFIDSMSDYTYKAADLKINNEIYTLPWESRTFVHWYRNDIFNNVPASMDDLIASRASKSTGMNMAFAIGLSDGSNAASFMESFIPLLRSAGGELFDSNGKAIFNSPAGVKVLTFLKNLIGSKTMNESVLTLGVDEIVDGFKAGTIYSMNAGTQRAASIRNSTLNDKIISAPIPGFTSGTPAPPLVAGQSLGIGAFSKYPDMAFDFITYFYSTENQVKWLKANVLPARSTVFEDAAIKALSNYDELKQWNGYAGTGRIVFYPEDYAELSVNLVQAAQRVVFRNEDAKSALDQVANWYNKKVTVHEPIVESYKTW
jgi:ABC-type glycerol-3-phosphate transport system substrate-binding protein